MKTVWSKADLHVHTTHSDGHTSVEEVLEHAASRTDLGVIAITDHDTIDGALEARALAEAYGIEVVVGEEVSTADGELLAFFVEHGLPSGLPASETIAAVHELGGLAVAAHPYHMLVPSVGRRGLSSRASGSDPEWPLDAVETFNAGFQLPGGNRRAAATAASLGLPALGGSDSHHPGTIGYGHTLFPGRGAADLRAAIVQGRTVAAGRPWGLLRTAEVVGLIAGQQLGNPAKLMARGIRSRTPSFANLPGHGGSGTSDGVPEQSRVYRGGNRTPRNIEATVRQNGGWFGASRRSRIGPRVRLRTAGDPR